MECRHCEKRNNCSTSFSTDGGGTVGMVGALWEFLPDEVVRTILASLPLPSLLRYRSVCKKWNSLLKDQHFQETRERIHGGEQLYRQYIQLMEKSPSFAGSQVVSSVGSLLLLTANDSNAIHVVDPSKATLIEIPQQPTLGSSTHKYIGCAMVRSENVLSKVRRSGSRYYTVGMVVNPQTRVYNILAISKGSCGPVTLQLYDCSLDSWQAAGSILAEPCLIGFHIVGVVLLDSAPHSAALYCLTVGLKKIDLTPQFRVFRFEKQRRRWHDLPVFPSRVCYENRSSPLLFRHRGRLLFAGVTATSSNKTFYIWEYDFEKLEWNVADFLPSDVSTLFQLGGSSQMGMAFFSHACGDHLCVGAYPTSKKNMTLSSACVSSLDGRGSSVTSVLIYNLVERCWRLLQRPEGENLLISWLRRRFLYEASPFAPSHQQ